jgi:hypothetical protein
VDKVRTYLILSCVSLYSASSLAQEQPYPPPSEGWACYLDYQKFCPKVQPGDGRIKACLAVRKDELSERCVYALRTVGTLPPAEKSKGGS